MTKNHPINSNETLEGLCFDIKRLVESGEINQASELIQQAMADFPDSPVPHNLLGIVLERKGDHYTAMRHFRAAWSLEPSYLPAKHNLEVFGQYKITGTCAYHETDCKA